VRLHNAETKTETNVTAVITKLRSGEFGTAQEVELSYQQFLCFFTADTAFRLCLKLHTCAAMVSSSKGFSTVKLKKVFIFFSFYSSPLVYIINY
jgi:hypothetical protein